MKDPNIDDLYEQTALERESNRIKNSVSKKEQEQKKKKKKRTTLLVICYIFITLIFAAWILFYLSNTRSKKESNRVDGITAYQNKDYSKAVELFSESLAENQWFSKNMDVDTKMYLAACYMKLQDYEDALVVYNDIMSTNTGKIEKDTIKSLQTLATALNDIQKDAISDTDIEALQYAAKGGDDTMYLYLAAYYAKLEDEENMLTNISSYLSSNEGNTYTDYELSKYYLKQGDLQLAKTYIDHGLTAGDDLFLDGIEFNEAVWYEKNNDMESAFSIVEELHNNYPDNEAYENEYNFLYTRLNVNPEPVHSESDD